MADTVAFPTEEKEEVNDALSDAVWSRIFSFLPAWETPGMRQLSRKCLEVTEKYYQDLNLPVLAVVNIQFEVTGATVSIITDRQPDLNKLKNCIRCTATHLVVYSQFQPAFYNFQRNFGIAPELWPLEGSTDSCLTVRVPVNSLEESVALLLNYLKRNVAIRQLIMTDQNTSGDKNIITGNMYKVIESFGRSVSTCQVCPILHIDFSPEYVQIFQNMLKTYNGWICNLKEFSQNDVEAIKKMRSPWLYLERQPPAIIFFQMLGTLLRDWITCKTDIICINCRIISKHDWEEGLRYMKYLNYYEHYIVRSFFGSIIMDPFPGLFHTAAANDALVCIGYEQERLIMCTNQLKKYFGFHLNSQLAVLDNAEAQNYVEFNAQSVPLLWIGLKCKASNPAACFWDNLKPLSLGFSNFAPGHPNVKLGECVGFVGLTDQGYWYSTSCDKEAIIACNRPSKFKLPPRVALPKNNYSRFPNLGETGFMGPL